MSRRDKLWLEGCLGLLWLVSGCATPDSVVLLRSVGDSPAVTVENAHGSETLTHPRDSIEFRKADLLTRTTTPVEIRERFGQVLDVTPAPSRQYVIQFATGQSALPLEADSTVAALLADVAAHPFVEVEITGHTDRAGGVEANDQLSKQRAVAVREALIVRGLKASLIRVVGRGERQVLVPTADEVAEPKNRRVEILVR